MSYFLLLPQISSCSDDVVLSLVAEPVGVGEGRNVAVDDDPDRAWLPYPVSIPSDTSSSSVARPLAFAAGPGREPWELDNV